MTLYTPIPGLFKFEKIYSNDEYLQKNLKQKEGSISKWDIKEDTDREELKNILVNNQINYKII